RRSPTSRWTRPKSLRKGSPVATALVPPVAERGEAGEGDGEDGERGEGARRRAAARRGSGEGVRERPRRQERRDPLHEPRQPLRPHPEPAAVAEPEVKQIRDRQRAAGRGPVADCDAEEGERDRA